MDGCEESRNEEDGSTNEEQLTTVLTPEEPSHAAASRPRASSRDLARYASTSSSRVRAWTSHAGSKIGLVVRTTALICRGVSLATITSQRLARASNCDGGPTTR